MSRIDAGICGGAVCAGGLGLDRRFTGLIAARASSMDARTQADLSGVIRGGTTVADPPAERTYAVS
jgi:hypothetical protein